MANPAPPVISSHLESGCAVIVRLDGQAVLRGPTSSLTIGVRRTTFGLEKAQLN
jgi:hypothetical protein